MDGDEYLCEISGEIRPVKIPVIDGEGLVVPNSCALIFRDPRESEILLQKRDKPGELVRHRLELPGGRWRAGESPLETISREVKEETGLDIAVCDTESVEHGETPVIFISTLPLMVVTGHQRGYPVLLVVYRCVALGDVPRALAGETADPGWYKVADIRRMLTENDRFTGPTFAVLERYLRLKGDNRL